MSLSLFKRTYRHLNKIYVSADAIRHNYETLSRIRPGMKIAPVLKSNAYGHGIRTVAPAFDRLNPAFLAVDSLYEAYELSKLKVKSTILVMGYTNLENYSIKKLPFHFCIYDMDTARQLNASQRNCHVHVFVDTGMCREGVPIYSLPDFLNALGKLRNLKIVGLGSHLADADNPRNDSFTRKQVAAYKRALGMCESMGIRPVWRHIAASSGAPKVEDGIFNMVRPGLASYGINPFSVADPSYPTYMLRPALRFVSTLAQIKTIDKGDWVGYGRTFKAPSKTTIGLLPAGYYEGIDRRLSNKGMVTVRGFPCRILGRVSMNMVSVDLTGAAGCRVGDEATVYSDVPNAPNSIANTASVADTIPYDILVHLAESVRRELV